MQEESARIPKAVMKKRDEMSPMDTNKSGTLKIEDIRAALFAANGNSGEM